MSDSPEDADRAMNRRGRLGAGQAAHLDGLVGAGLLRALGIGKLVRSDIADGAVHALSAEVSFAPSHPPAGHGVWVARTADGQTLEIWAARAPLPGPHVVYVLPRSRHVVGTEGDKPSNLATYASLLAAAQQVTPNDMAALRAGVLPGSLLRLATRAPRRSDVILGTLTLVIGLCLAALVPVTLLLPPAQAPRVPIAPAMGLSLFLVFCGWLFGLRPWMRVRAGARSGRVRTLEGPIRRDWRGTKSMSFFIHVSGVDVDVTDRRPLWDLVVEGVEHRLYVTDADVLLGIEPRM